MEQGERTSYTKNIMSHNVPRLSRDLHLSCTNLRQRAGTLPGLFFFFFHFRHKAKWSALKSCCDQKKKKKEAMGMYHIRRKTYLGIHQA